MGCGLDFPPTELFGIKDLLKLVEPGRVSAGGDPETGIYRQEQKKLRRRGWEKTQVGGYKMHVFG